MKITRTSIDTLNQLATTSDRLEALMTDMLHYRLSSHCTEAIKRMASLPPLIRLMVNLKQVLTLIKEQDTQPDLRAVLTPDEYTVLLEIDSSNMGIESRRTAHSLFDIEARIKFVASYGGTFKDVRLRESHRLVSRPLD
jgi:hypothetical protein